MVVSCIAHLEQLDHLHCRLVASRFEKFYEEKVSDDEILFAVRTSSFSDAQYLGGLLYRAGALQVTIDVEAA